MGTRVANAPTSQSGALPKIAAVLVVVAIAGVAGVFLSARSRLNRVWEIAPPPIVAATSPEAVARGEQIFLAACLDCHVSPDSGKAAGGRMPGPAWIGEIHAANLTAHPEDGIAGVSDALVARVIRTGIRRDGRVALEMPRYPAMGDADVAALLGFLRATPPHSLLEPTAGKQPPAAPTLRGALELSRRNAPAPEGARAGIAVPPIGSTLDYGRYLAEDVYRCRDCHTAAGGEPYAGGSVFDLADGSRVVASNVSPSRTHGIGEWTVADFVRAVRDGVGKGYVLRHPMPRLRRSDDVELGAIYAWLQSQPAREVAVPHAEGEHPREAVSADAKPEELFLKLGCPSCHAKGAPYARKIRQAKGKPVDEVAAWIRNPQSKIPGTPMPTFATLMTEEQSTQLAGWVLTRLDQNHPF